MVDAGPEIAAEMERIQGVLFCQKFQESHQNFTVKLKSMQRVPNIKEIEIIGEF